MSELSTGGRLLLTSGAGLREAARAGSVYRLPHRCCVGHQRLDGDCDRPTRRRSGRLAKMSTYYHVKAGAGKKRIAVLVGEGTTGDGGSSQSSPAAPANAREEVWSPSQLAKGPVSTRATAARTCGTISLIGVVLRRHGPDGQRRQRVNEYHARSTSVGRAWRHGRRYDGRKCRGTSGELSLTSADAGEDGVSGDITLVTGVATGGTSGRITLPLGCGNRRRLGAVSCSRLAMATTTTVGTSVSRRAATTAMAQKGGRHRCRRQGRGAHSSDGGNGGNVELFGGEAKGQNSNDNGGNGEVTGGTAFAGYGGSVRDGGLGTRPSGAVLINTGNARQRSRERLHDTEHRHVALGRTGYLSLVTGRAHEWKRWVRQRARR